MIQGLWQPVWAPVIEAFRANFEHLGEQGAGLALVHRGELVVNVWAGQYDNRIASIANENWQEQTCVNIFSAGKGLVALAALMLVDEGKLSLDEPIATVWPEFGQHGKSAITLRHILCHRAGLSAFNQRVGDQQIFDWSQMVQLVEQDTPWWEANTQQGYSPFLYGWVLGEVVKRVSGSESFNDFFQQAIAKPLGVNCEFGLPNEKLASIADTTPLKRAIPAISDDADIAALGRRMKADPRGVTNQSFTNPPTLMTSTNSLAWRQAQIPAANGHCNASALATIYGNLASGHSSLLSNKVLPLCWQEQSFELDRVLGLPIRFGAGFILSQLNRPDCRFGRGQRAFGHTGAGGCVGFADLDYGIGFGYVTNRMGPSLLIDQRADHLIDAIYTIVEM